MPLWREKLRLLPIYSCRYWSLVYLKFILILYCKWNVKSAMRLFVFLKCFFFSTIFLVSFFGFIFVNWIKWKFIWYDIALFKQRNISAEERSNYVIMNASLSDIAIKGRGGGVIEEHCRLTLISKKFQLKNVEML